MHEPGARVEGHRAEVHVRGPRWRTSCTCGLRVDVSDVGSACLVLVQHLQAAVRDGARVVGSGHGDDDGSSGVREPRRPRPSPGTGTVELDSA